MSKYAIEDTTLTAIGDAIRGKEGSTEPIMVSDFANRIAAISGGGGDTPGGSGEMDLSISIKEQMINEVGEVWVNRIHSYLDTVSNSYAAAVIETYGQEGDSVFPSGKFAKGTMSQYGILNFNTLADAGVTFDGSLKITSGDYMEEVKPGMWRMIVWLYNSSNADSKTLFSSSYNWEDDIRLPYLCTNCATSSASSESDYQIVTANTTYGLDAECYEFRNMSYKYRHRLTLHGNKYMIIKYDSSTYGVQYSSPDMLRIPAYAYNVANCKSAKYIDVDGLYTNGNSSYGKYLSFFAKSPQIKRVSFKDCRLYAYLTLRFYLYNSYADFSGVTWTNYSGVLTDTPSNPIAFHFAKGEGWKDRLVYFAEHMPVLTRTVKINLPKFLEGEWGQTNVVQPLIEKGYTVTTTLNTYTE